MKKIFLIITIILFTLFFFINCYAMVTYEEAKKYINKVVLILPYFSGGYSATTIVGTKGYMREIIVIGNKCCGHHYFIVIQQVSSGDYLIYDIENILEIRETK